MVGSWLGCVVGVFCVVYLKKVQCSVLVKFLRMMTSKVVKRIRSFLWHTVQIFKTIKPNLPLFFFLLFLDSQEKTQDQYVENSHLTSVPQWVNNNSLGKYFKKCDILHLLCLF